MPEVIPIKKDLFYKKNNYEAVKLNHSNENFSIVKSLMLLKSKNFSLNSDDRFKFDSTTGFDIIEVYKDDKLLTCMGIVKPEDKQEASELFTIMNPFSLSIDDYANFIDILNYFNIKKINDSVNFKLKFIEYNNGIFPSENINPEEEFCNKTFNTPISYKARYDERCFILSNSDFDQITFENLNIDSIEDCKINACKILNSTIKNINQVKANTIILKDCHVSNINLCANKFYFSGTSSVEHNINFKGHSPNSFIFIENNEALLNSINKIDCDRIFLFDTKDNDKNIEKLILKKIASKKWNFKTISYNDKVYHYDHFHLLRKERLNLRIK